MPGYLNLIVPKGRILDSLLMFTVSWRMSAPSPRNGFKWSIDLQRILWTWVSSFIVNKKGTNWDILILVCPASLLFRPFHIGKAWRESKQFQFSVSELGIDCDRKDSKLKWDERSGPNEQKWLVAGNSLMLICAAKNIFSKLLGGRVASWSLQKAQEKPMLFLQPLCETCSRALPTSK